MEITNPPPSTGFGPVSFLIAIPSLAVSIRLRGRIATCRSVPLQIGLTSGALRLASEEVSTEMTVFEDLVWQQFEADFYDSSDFLRTSYEKEWQALDGWAFFPDNVTQRSQTPTYLPIRHVVNRSREEGSDEQVIMEHGLALTSLDIEKLVFQTAGVTQRQVGWNDGELPSTREILETLPAPILGR